MSKYINHLLRQEDEHRKSENVSRLFITPRGVAS